MLNDSPTRRAFLRNSSAVSATLMIPSLALAAQKPQSPGKNKKDDNDPDAEKISPAEDLMREHGVLNRILLIYDHHLAILTAKQTFDGSVLANAADIIRHFVEEYHEKLEEEFLF